MTVAAEVVVPPNGATPPSARILWLIGAAGLAAASASVALALASDHVGDPLVRSALIDWISSVHPQRSDRVVAATGQPPWRADDRGRLCDGPLRAPVASSDVPYTVGVIFDVLPVVLFLHVYLAFPSGRLRSPFERGLVAAGYVSAVGLQLVKMSLGGVGPHNLLELSTRATAAATVEQVQLLSISAICLIGIGVLAARRRQAGRPLRRPVALLIDSFALGLVMIAVLFISGAFQGPAFQTIQRATLLVIGISPIAFLIGLLDARLARSAVGDLFVELRADPSPAGSPGRACTCASRSVADACVLAARVRELGRSRRSTRRAARAGERQGDDADRPRRRAHGGASA